jgi:acetoacetyl-CoA synthetase
LGYKYNTIGSIVAQGILDRYGQVLPKFIFSETEVLYSGKTINVLPKVKEIANNLSSKGLQYVVLLPSIKTGLEVSQEIVESVLLGSVIYNVVISGIP